MLHYDSDRRALFNRAGLERDHRGWNAGSGAIEEAPHAPGFRALYLYQALLAPNMISVVEMHNLSLVAGCVGLQTFDAFFDQEPESRADLESMLSTLTGVFDRHCKTPRVGPIEKICEGYLKVFPPAPS
jgi:hypothetical protein